MCIFFLCSTDNKCPAKQAVYNAIFIQEEALRSRCSDAVGDGSRYDPNFKLCHLATATHSTAGQQCSECTGTMQAWKGMGMKEAMLKTIAETPRATQIPVTIQEKPTDELLNKKSSPSAPKKSPAVKKDSVHDTFEQTKSSISSHAAPTSTPSATTSSPNPSSRLRIVESATTAPSSRPGSHRFILPKILEEFRTTDPSTPGPPPLWSFVQIPPSPAVRSAPAKVYPTMTSQPNTGQQPYVTHQPYPTQQSGSLRRKADENTLRETNKRLRSGLTQLAMERARGARDIAQLLASNERQATKIEELEEELEGLRGRVAAVEGRRNSMGL